MSVIGPRPLLVEYLPYYTKEEHHRHDVRPGLYRKLYNSIELYDGRRQRTFLLHKAEEDRSRGNRRSCLNTNI